MCAMLTTMKWRILCYLKILVLLLSVFIPCQSYAGMTLFNDNGNWELGILGDPEDGNVTYRTCKNSSDRLVEADSEESLAILCITLSQKSGDIDAGIWMDETLNENAQKVRCHLFFDDGVTFSETCNVAKSKIGTLKIELSRNPAVLKKLIDSAGVKILFEDTFTLSGEAPELRFDLDPKNFAKVAGPIYGHLANLE